MSTLMLMLPLVDHENYILHWLLSLEVVWDVEDCCYQNCLEVYVIRYWDSALPRCTVAKLGTS